MRRSILTLTAALFVITATLLIAQQDKSKRPSPPGTAEVTLSGKKVVIDYSRPKTADPKTGQPRKVMGGIVPYGKVWRTGANEATSLKTEVDLMVGTLHVPAGSYTLFTFPGEKSWTLVVNKQTGQWGTEYSEAQDLGRTEMKVAKTPKTVDQFTISFAKKGADTANLMLDWENTRAWVEVKAHGK
jgi:hypothetical protein